MNCLVMDVDICFLWGVSVYKHAVGVLISCLIKETFISQRVSTLTLEDQLM